MEVGNLQLLTELHEPLSIGPVKRAWHFSSDETPLLRENVMPCRLPGTDPVNFLEARFWIHSGWSTARSRTRPAFWNL
jgi:hypothetical protein